MKFSCRMSPLVIYKILRLFINILTADDKYSLLIRDNLEQPIQLKLSKKNHFLNDFCRFGNVDQIWNIFKRR